MYLDLYVSKMKIFDFQHHILSVSGLFLQPVVLSINKSRCNYVREHLSLLYLIEWNKYILVGSLKVKVGVCVEVCGCMQA